MRNALILLLLLCGEHAFAQTVRVKKDVIYRDGQPYAQVRQSGVGIKSYSYRTPEGREFMMMNYDDKSGEYIVTFLDSERQTRLPRRFGTVSVMAQEIVDNNLLENGQPNPAGERRFLLAHPAPASPAADAARGSTGGSIEQGLERAGRSVAATSGSIAEGLSQVGEGLYQAATGIAATVERVIDEEFSGGRLGTRTAEDEMVIRNRSARVLIEGNEIRQAERTIGRYSKETSEVEGAANTVYSFYLPGGRLVAVATPAAAAPGTYELLTTRENRMESLVPKAKSEAEILQEIATYLVKQRHL